MEAKRTAIPIVDLFAGPGGLGEGFSSLRDIDGKPLFQIRLSIEKDYWAHKTLELRSFFRQFPDGDAPEDYYRYIRREGISRKELFDRYKSEAGLAQDEAWLFELQANSAEAIDRRIEKALRGERTWVLIGGPPCQAYSVIGRVRIRGESVQKYETDPRHHLYMEYLRILETHRPAVFVMENVKGLLSSRVNGEGIFQRIVSDISSLKQSKTKKGYQLFSLGCPAEVIRPKDFIIRAEKHDIPQKRHRVIIVGIRTDLNVSPTRLHNCDTTITTKDAILDLPRIRSGLSKEPDSFMLWSQALGEFAQEMCGNESTPQDVRQEVKISRTVRKDLTLGGEFISSNQGREMSEWLREHAWWFHDERLNGFCNHSARSHIRQDLFRYLYAACHAKARNASPRIYEFPVSLRPAHKNIQDAAPRQIFADRFRVQLENGPATTIVSHISKDGHYYIHPDPTQCRSLTVREAARLQTFPDNYFFEGNRTSQYAQVGNAVPPLLARQIGQRVAEIVLDRHHRDQASAAADQDD